MKKIIAGILLFAAITASEAIAAEKAILVRQPAYHSMSFYVYKPVNVPKDFYVTFDGYLVYKNAKGVWHYASAEKSGITKTGYVVGAVIPYVVKLKPYNAQISSVAPVLGSNKVVEYPAADSTTSNVGSSIITLPPSTNAVKEPLSSRIIYMPPNSGLEVYNSPSMSPNASDWTQNSNFMAIGKWQKSVDRMGVLARPKLPVAWKGDYPDVVYAWTGMQWRQLASKTSGATARNIIRREIYDLTVHTNKTNMLNWTDDDTHVLSQYAAMWGYQWAGQIILGRDYY